MNYRGSTGYGQDGVFSLLGKIGTQDVTDVQVSSMMSLLICVTTPTVGCKCWVYGRERCWSFTSSLWYKHKLNFSLTHTLSHIHCTHTHTIANTLTHCQGHSCQPTWLSFTFRSLVSSVYIFTLTTYSSVDSATVSLQDKCVCDTSCTLRCLDDDPCRFTHCFVVVATEIVEECSWLDGSWSRTNSCVICCKFVCVCVFVFLL